MTSSPLDVAMAGETMAMVRDALGLLPAHSAFAAREWNGDVATEAARIWVKSHPREAAAIVAVLANLAAHVDRQAATGAN